MFSFSEGRRWTAAGVLTSRRGPDEGFLPAPLPRTGKTSSSRPPKPPMNEAGECRGHCEGAKNGKRTWVRWLTPAWGNLRHAKNPHMAVSENADIESHVCASRRVPGFAYPFLPFPLSPCISP